MLLPSEMLAAAEAAEERGVPISLGDTDVGELGPRLKELLIASLMDLLSPGEGWKRIGDDLKRGAKLAFDTSDLDGDALEFSDFLKPDLLLGFVTSLLAYPAARPWSRLPIPVGNYLGLLVGSAFGAHYLEQAAREADALAAAGDDSASYLLLSAVLIVLDILFPIVFLDGCSSSRCSRSGTCAWPGQSPPAAGPEATSSRSDVEIVDRTGPRRRSTSTPARRAWRRDPHRATGTGGRVRPAKAARLLAPVRLRRGAARRTRRYGGGT